MPDVVRETAVHPDPPVAVVTGGTRGVGRAITLRLAARGHRVVVVYSRDAAAAAEVTQGVAELGGECIALRANLGDSDEVNRVFDEIAQTVGRVDVLVNNAGSGAMRPVRDLPVRHFDRSMALNVRAVLHCSQRAAQLMPDGGAIVTITSIGSIRVLPGYTAVGVAKAAAETLTGYLGAELAGSGITVNALCVGPLPTAALQSFPGAENMLETSVSRTPTGRLTTPEDVADAVEFFVGPGARQICGQTLVVDGGLAMTMHVY